MIGKTTRVLREKLQDCHGDTMVEVLAAVFIAALGATMLATMVTVSASASARSQQVLNASYASENSLYAMRHCAVAAEYLTATCSRTQ